MRFDTMVNSKQRGVTLNHVSIQRGHHVLLEDGSLEVPAGETLAVMGQSGVGKSTLLHAIAGLFNQTSGEIERYDAPVAMIFQEPRLLPWRTVQQNVELALDASEWSQASLWLERVGLSHVARDYPAALSGGMRQRVSIARAFARRAHVMLVDEPFAHLDLNTADALRMVLVDHLSDADYATFWVTHSPTEAVAVASRTLVLAGPPTGAWRIVDHVDSQHNEDSAARAVGELTSLIHDFTPTHERNPSTLIQLGESE